eukprot:gnl/Ergobibamus_cyprinoides/772.p1 GENE.gnl/Ergobibamus_cyprinoides/772~~gnl/Ergobibamus_cyprinoides/772.p1  ORF type:complete len:253 (+),score=51.83 gnl/Ergobibamus_cyprinoides/772:49-759(+)
MLAPCPVRPAPAIHVLVRRLAVSAFLLAEVTFLSTVAFLCVETEGGHLPRHLSDFGHAARPLSMVWNGAVFLTGMAMTLISFYLTPAVLLRAASPSLTARQRCAHRVIALCVPFLGVGVSGTGVWTSDTNLQHCISLYVSSAFWAAILIANIVAAPSPAWRAAGCALLAWGVLYAANDPEQAIHELSIPLQFTTLLCVIYLSLVLRTPLGQSDPERRFVRGKAASDSSQTSHLISD